MKAGKTTVGRYRMHYRYDGKPGRDAVVFVHGIPTNSYLWEATVVPFIAERYSVVTLDLIGYGRSDRAPYYDLTLPKQADYIVNLLNQLGLARAHFVGHDLGGGILQILAIRYPQSVSSLVIADGVCFANWPLPKVVSIRWPTADEFYPSPLFIERMIREGVYDPQCLTPSMLRAFTLPFSTPSGPEELRQASLALNHHQTEDLVPYLPQIRCPATLLWGQHDRYLVPYWGWLLHQFIPRSSLKILPNCSHYSMIDNPGLFAGELLQHLDAQTR